MSTVADNDLDGAEDQLKWHDRALRHGVRLLTGRNYPKLRTADLRYLCSKAGMNYLRGALWQIRHFRRPNGFLLADGIKFISADRLKLGRGVSIGRLSYLDCTGQLVQLGDGVTLREYTWLQCRSGLNEAGGKVILGDRVYLGPFAVLGAGGDVIIGEGSQIGARLTIAAESHARSDERNFVGGGVNRTGIQIGRRCWFGNNVVVVDGVTIGDDCSIGAGSVVTRDIPSGSMAYGVPARVVRQS